MYKIWVLVCNTEFELHTTILEQSMKQNIYLNIQLALTWIEIVL